MQEETTRKGNARSLLWLLLLVVVAVAWWYLRSANAEVATTDLRAEQTALADFGDPDDILVDLDDDASDADVEDLEKKFDIDLVLVSDESRDERFYRAHVDAFRRDTLLSKLEADELVELAEPDALYSINIGCKHFTKSDLPPEANQPKILKGFWEHGGFDATEVETQWEGFPNDPMYKNQWHMDQIHMPEAWKLADGDGVIVAVLDTGVGYENYNNIFHLVEDLDGVEFVKPYDFVGNNKHANDDHGHGTHVAGTIAQVTHNGIGVSGIGRKVKIMPLKVLSGSGSGSVAGIADAIRYAADEGAQVINMSLGGPFPSRALKKAVEYAHKKGVTVIAAAGNDGRSKVGYPAAYPGAVAVSATQFDETVTFYSNYGKHIAIAAPGGNTRVDQNGDGMPDGVLQNTIEIRNPEKSDYYGYMGTSMASPHVAGVAALVVGEGITDPAAVERVLKESARAPKSGELDKSRYGAGIVDAKAAVLMARSETGGWQFLLGLLMAGAVGFSMRRRGILGVKLGVGYLGGIVAGASGLFFLPLIAPELSSLPLIETLTRGLPSWDLGLLGAAGHGNALFFSALVPFGLIALLYGVPKLRGILAGLAIGVAAHLGFHAMMGLTDIEYVPNLLGSGLDILWLTINAGICVMLARAALRR